MEGEGTNYSYGIYLQCLLSCINTFYKLYAKKNITRKLDKYRGEVTTEV